MPDYDIVEDIRTCPEVLAKIRTRNEYAQNLYSAMCNMRWIKRDMWPLLKEEYWSCSWRAAGGIVADLQNKGGDYMDWYCSGMGGIGDYNPEAEKFEDWQQRTKYVPEGVVTDEIELDLNQLGWIPSPWPEDNK
jgi:hypothetical protein